MSILIVHGTKLEAHEIGEIDVFCGRCIEVTQHQVSVLEAKHHVYFITYGSDFAGYVAKCKTCEGVVPLDRKTGDRVKAGRYRADPTLTLRGLAEPDRVQRMFDAFAAAHLLDLERARKSWWVGLLFAGLVVTLGPIAIMAAIELEGPARLVVLGVLAALAVAVYFAGLRWIGDLLLARRVVPVVGKLLDATRSSLVELQLALERTGYHDLARHLRTSHYAAPRARDGATPRR